MERTTPGRQLAREAGQRVPRPDLGGGRGLPPPGRAPAGDRLRLRARRAAAAGATSAPRSRRSSATRPEEWLADAEPLGEAAAPRGPRAGARRRRRARRSGNRNPPPVDYRMITRDGRIVWILDEAVLEPDEDGTPVWHGVLYDITERKLAEQESAARRGPAGRGRAPRRAGAAGRRPGGPDGRGGLADDRDRRSRRGLHLGDRPRRPPAAACAPGSRIASSAPTRASAARDSHAGAALDSRLHVIVDDWSSERRFSMPPALRAIGVRSSLAVPIDGKEQPFGVLDIHSTEPNRFTPQDVHFVQASANVLADAIERHAADQALRHRVLHDSLTGLPNRLSFVDSLSDALKRSTVSGSPVGILFLDLDHFKLINDSLGHHAGDELLRAVAPRLRAHLRPGDIVARFGGDEFGILVDRLADEDEAVAIADRIAGCLRRALRDGRRRPLRQRQRRHRRGPALSPRAGRRRAADPRRRRGDVPGEGARPRALRALRRGDAGAGAAPAGGRARAAPGARARRAGAPLPAGDRAAQRRDHRPRGAGPLAPPRARPARPRRLRLGRRGQRPDRADRALGAGGGLSPGAGVARAASRPAPVRRLGQPLGAAGDQPRPGRLDRRDPRRQRPRSRSTCGSRSPRAPWSRSRRRRPGPWKRSATSASASSSTTSAPATPRSPTSTASPSTRSRSTAPSSTPSASNRSARRSSRRSSAWPAPSPST